MNNICSVNNTKTKPEIAQVEPLPSWMEEKLAEHFVVYKIFDLKENAINSDTIKYNIRGLACDGNASKKIISQFPNLEIISSYSVGVDGIDISYAKNNQILVTNTPGVLTNCVADLAMGLVITLNRRIVEADHFVRSGNWRNNSFPLGNSLFNKMVGIVGLGRIGKAVAKRATAFGMRIAYYGSSLQNECDYQYFPDPVSLAKASDILIICTSGRKDNQGLISSKVLTALGPAGKLVNIARGSIIDEEALLYALENNEIGGAALDVYLNEPRINERLLNLENVILQPHHASGTEETRKAMGELMIENLKRHFSGNTVLSQVM